MTRVRVQFWSKEGEPEMLDLAGPRRLQSSRGNMLARRKPIGPFDATYRGSWSS